MSVRQHHDERGHGSNDASQVGDSNKNIANYLRSYVTFVSLGSLKKVTEQFSTFILQDVLVFGEIGLLEEHHPETRTASGCASRFPKLRVDIASLVEQSQG